MKVYNVAAAVVALVPAEGEADAIRKLNKALSDAGFEPMDTEGNLPDAFESEANTQPDEMWRTGA